MTELDRIQTYLEGIAYIARGNMVDNLKELQDALKQASTMVTLAQDAKQYVSEILEYNGEIAVREGQESFTYELQFNRGYYSPLPQGGQPVG